MLRSLLRTVTNVLRPVPTLQPDDQIGPYTLVRRLGSGAFGDVWLAQRRTRIATTQAAIKVPLQSTIDLGAIKHEAAIWVRATGHPNVVPIFEADIYDGRVVIASEYAPEGSLAQWFDRSRGDTRPRVTAIEMMGGILLGLEHLHRLGIVHRDLKPANVLLQHQTPRLTDFGISRLLRSTNQTRSIAGTPPYMAPEAFDGQRSERTDLWSAGVICCQLVTGQLPFPQRDVQSLISAIREDEPQLPDGAQLSNALRGFIERALSKDPHERFSSAAEMRIAWHAASLGEPEFSTPFDLKSTDPLAILRMQMLSATSRDQLERCLHEVNEFALKHKGNAEARMMRNQLIRALQREARLSGDEMAMPGARFEVGAPEAERPTHMTPSHGRSWFAILTFIAFCVAAAYIVTRWFL